MATKKPNPLGSLIPQTNRELVSLSYKMNMANVPKDLSNIFNKIGDSYTRGADSLGKGIGQAFETAGEIYAKVKEENDQEESDTKTSKKFKNGKVGKNPTGVVVPDGYDETDNSYYKLDDPNTTDVDEFDIIGKDELFKPIEYTRKDLAGNDEKINVMNFEDHQTFIKKKKKEIKKKYKIGDPKRKELLQSLKDREEKARESSILFSKTEIEIDQIIADGNLSENMTNSKKIQFLRAIKNNGELVDDGNGNKSRALMGFNKDGEIIFSYVDENGAPIMDSSGNAITVSPGNAKSLVTQKDNDMRNKIKTVQNDYLTQGTSGTKITDAYSKKQQDNIVSLITDKKKFNDVLGFKPDGFNQNFEQAVLGFATKDEISNMPEKILSSFPKNFVEDTDGVEGVSAGDFKTQENYKKLSNALLDSSDPNFNLSRSAELVGEFMNSKFKTDGAGAYQGYLTNPDNAGEIERQRKANIVQTTPPELTGKDLTLQNMYKTDKGRQTINRFNTFTEIVTGEGTGQTNIDIESDGSGNILKSVKIDKTNGKIFETTAKSGEEPVTNEISYNKLITLLTGNSGMSVSEATNLMGLDLKQIKETFKTKRGDIKPNTSKSNLPDVMGREEEYGVDVFDNHFTKQIKDKDFRITEPTDGNNMLVFTNSAGGEFKYYTFENDIAGGGDVASQNMLLEAWVKSAKKLNEK